MVDQDAAEWRPGYCTFALTVDVLVSVKVQVLRLLPPLEHAPDQIASRPWVTLNVIAVPEVKTADPLLPVATLIPVGLDVTRSPLRLLVVTVNVAVGGGGGAGAVIPMLAARVAPSSGGAGGRGTADAIAPTVPAAMMIGATTAVTVRSVDQRVRMNSLPARRGVGSRSSREQETSHESAVGRSRTRRFG
jgi:hypothetical protein